MNVLLAEADIPYDRLKEMDEINTSFNQIDVTIVIGANDVVNPVARTDPASPIYGMPILDADKARNVVVIKRNIARSVTCCSPASAIPPLAKGPPSRAA